jgi:tetratricopeptide (TPR) repeat protein
VRQRQADFIASRYFANLALAEEPGSTEAQAILKASTRALQESTQREQTIRKGLLAVDSLLSYGQFQAASQTAEALRQVAANNPAVKAAVRRTRFEHWRATAANAYEEGSYPVAVAALDSALILFPGHQVCLDLRASVLKAMASTPSSAKSPAASLSLSTELEAQVRSLYESGRQSFQQGLLGEAISRWEKVELLAPGYQAVRSYLVNAYKFVGVEHYGQNRPEEAIAAWRKAALLEPDNAEIANYIRRTENEVRRLNELSHGR